MQTRFWGCLVIAVSHSIQVPEAIQDVEDGGANTQRGFGIMTILLLGMVAIMLS